MRLDTTKNFSLISDDLGVPQATFVFTFVFEKYTKENIFQTLNAFFQITHAFLWKMLLNRPPIIGPLFVGVY